MASSLFLSTQKDAGFVLLLQRTHGRKKSDWFYTVCAARGVAVVAPQRFVAGCSVMVAVCNYWHTLKNVQYSSR